MSKARSYFGGSRADLISGNFHKFEMTVLSLKFVKYGLGLATFNEPEHYSSGLMRACQNLHGLVCGQLYIL